MFIVLQIVRFEKKEQGFLVQGVVLFQATEDGVSYTINTNSSVDQGLLR